MPRNDETDETTGEEAEAFTPPASYEDARKRTVDALLEMVESGDEAPQMRLRAAGLVLGATV